MFTFSEYKCKVGKNGGIFIFIYYKLQLLSFNFIYMTAIYSYCIIIYNPDSE